MINFNKYLNPIAERLEEILRFEGIDLNDRTFQEEYPYFQKLLNLLSVDIKKQLERKKSLERQIEDQVLKIETETGDDKLSSVSYYNKLLSQMEQLFEYLNGDLAKFESPYFGKIIFSREKSSIAPARDINVYIGKQGYIDPVTQTPLISDWRAPIANLYYQNAGATENVQFESPAGIQKGELKQKRQFEISEGRITSIYDAKSGNAAADAFLLKQLNNRLGKKLADIVSTIQDQQNEIIREEVDQPVIIQGVAGSGKTTILLHRLAYVFYTYASKIKPEKSMIIAPNSMFLDYISDVLPSLGVFGIGQNTYIGFAKEILGWDKRYIFSPTPEDMAVKRYKGSIEHKKLMDLYFEEYEKKVLNSINDRVKDVIIERYKELKSNETLTMIERLNLAVDYAFAQFKFSSGSTGDFLGQGRHAERAAAIKAYLRKNSVPYSIYKDFFKNIYDYVDPESLEKFDLTIDQLQKHSLEGLKSEGSNTYYRHEDLAPILDIHLKLNGKKDYEKDSIVIDEAQDLSQYQIYMLLELAKGNNLTIAGDIAQSIVPPFYINDWVKLMNDFNDIRGNNLNFKYHQLHRSYRSTIEIIEYANQILKNHFPSSYKLPEAVLRHGDPVQTLEFNKTLAEENSEDIQILLKAVKESFDKGSATVALVCPNEEYAQSTYEIVKKYEDQIDRQVISFTKEDYHDGLLVLPITKAKGLEFDSVFLVDVNKNNYSGSELDIRLFYVAVTRALHRLFIITNRSEDSSPLMKS